MNATDFFLFTTGVTIAVGAGTYLVLSWAIRIAEELRDALKGNGER